MQLGYCLGAVALYGIDCAEKSGKAAVNGSKHEHAAAVFELCLLAGSRYFNSVFPHEQCVSDEHLASGNHCFYAASGHCGYSLDRRQAESTLLGGLSYRLCDGMLRAGFCGGAYAEKLGLVKRG